MYDSMKPSCPRVSTLDINGQGLAPLGPSLSSVHVALMVPTGLGGQLPGVGLLQAWLGSGTPSTHPPLSDLESEPPLPAPSLPAPPKEGRPALTRGSPGNHIQSHLGVSFQELMGHFLPFGTDPGPGTRHMPGAQHALFEGVGAGRGLFLCAPPVPGTPRRSGREGERLLEQRGIRWGFGGCREPPRIYVPVLTPGP